MQADDYERDSDMCSMLVKISVKKKDSYPIMIMIPLNRQVTIPHTWTFHDGSFENDMRPGIR